MAKRSVGLPFSRLLLNQALKTPMGATYHELYPSARTSNPSLLGRPFCSTSTPTAVRHLLAKMEMEKHLKLMESVANFLSKYFCFILLFCFPTSFLFHLCFLEWKSRCSLSSFLGLICIELLCCLIIMLSLFGIY